MSTSMYPKQDVLSHIDRAKVNLLVYIESKVPDIDREQIGHAVEYTILAHKNQYRRSGLPYVDHPFEVAKLLADFNMDSTTIIAGLLHDVVEDTKIPSSEIEKEFGSQVSFLVDAVTKISAIQAKSRIEQQAETFRKMLLSVAKDFRVIMIKFADRLHNMRTLGYMKDEKKKAIAAETLEVYAPLAHRFGLARIKWELEDLSFKHLNPDAYKNLVQKIVEKRAEREGYIRSLIKPVQQALEEHGTKARVYGRPKHFYSIWKKMQTRKCAFEDVYDLLALRVIVDTIPQCYEVLGIVHSLWSPLQTRFKDFIATPKSNMYQSLHTTLVGPKGKPVEIQIRTEDMNRTAEHGIAAHWAYKEKKAPRKVERENRWLNQFMDWQKDLKDSAEFMEFFRIDLKSDEIFVFTPKGDLKQLPKGSTALDYAFEVHTEVGIHCIGAKVDGKVVPLDKVLKTGSTVEILKSMAQTPSRDWLRIVTTSKAKSSIRRWLKKEEQEESIQLGKELLKREWQSMKISEKLEDCFTRFKTKYLVDSWDSLYQRIGNGDISLGSLEGFLQQHFELPSKSVFDKVRIKKSQPKMEAVLVSGLDHMLFKFASCCQPLPGDDILGYITKGKGVSIHRANCPEGIKLCKDQERTVPVQWKSEELSPQSVFIEVHAKDKPGLLYNITDVFKSCDIDVERASIITVKNKVRNRFKIRVSSAFQLSKAFNELRKIKEVQSVFRKSTSNMDF